MQKTYVDLLFTLDDGSNCKVTVKDTAENINASDITAVADLMIAKDCHRQGKLFTSLKRCTKYIVEEEVLVEA